MQRSLSHDRVGACMQIGYGAWVAGWTSFTIVLAFSVRVSTVALLRRLLAGPVPPFRASRGHANRRVDQASHGLEGERERRGSVFVS